MKGGNVSRSRIGICLALTLATLAVFGQVGSFAFIRFDDPLYVTNNPQVQAGLSWAGVRWAFTTTHAANWHPLTWLAHMADVQLFGLDPRGHHLVSLLLHTGNGLLLFLLLERLTGAPWPSAFAAALFALHPLRVESVAWVAERKDLLSGLFALLTLHAYVHYAARPTLRRYLLTCSALLLGLLAKPMLVTLPALLLLLDYWPLRRWPRQEPASPASSPFAPGHRRLLLEKLPLLALALGSCAITFYAQKQGHTVAPMDAYPLLPRVGNALIAYLRYLGKLIYPVDLAVFYPLPPQPPGANAVVAGLVLLVLTITVARLARRYPYLLTGWLWYLGMLVPVIGLVQVGMQSMADRYTYLPLIGIAIIIAWGATDLTRQLRWQRPLLLAGAALTLTLAAGLTWRHTGIWRDTATLFSHALAVTDNNYLAHAYLATAAFDRGDYPEAVRLNLLSLSLKPTQADVQHNIGLAYEQLGDLERAAEHFREAIRLQPDLIDTRSALAGIYSRQVRLDEAIAVLEELISLAPATAAAQYNLGVAYARLGKLTQAERHLAIAVQLAPGKRLYRQSLDLCRSQLGNIR
jgi:tetratricopeptide (TPR) repeat protein